MFKSLNKRKGQSTLEYAVLITIIIAALIAMNQYIKRGLQGRLKSASDDIGDQYSSGNTNYIKMTNTTGSSTETFNFGVTNSTMLTPEITNITENATILNTQQEYYGN